MSDDDISELLDQTVAVRISEPKSFGTEHGTGPFPGTVTSIRDATSSTQISPTARSEIFITHLNGGIVAGKRLYAARNFP